MRRFCQIPILLIALAGLPVMAQQPLTVGGVQSMLGTSRPIRMQVVDTSKAIAPSNSIANTFRAPRPPATFTLSRFFPKITAGPWPPKLPNLTSLFKAAPTPAPVNPQTAFKMPR